MIHCKELNRDFESKLEMFKALSKDKERIISFKKKHIFESKNKGSASNSFSNESIAKGIDGLEKGFIYPVISNTYFMDSHKDVHITDSMNRTVDMQQGKVHYAMNHDLSVGKIIAYPDQVEMLLKDVAWKDLGYDAEGSTQALIFKTNTFDYSPIEAVAAIKQQLPVQGSIRMQYVKMALAIKSDDPDLKEENAEYQKHIDKIVNRKEAEEDGYFWPVYELKIVEEGSMVVKGSNSVTEIQYPKAEPSEQDILNNEAAAQALRKKLFLINLNK
tara:strand:+ start:3828 stop:4646 length:819 start_codon:yes stop_codon:yes gene_type:complete